MRVRLIRPAYWTDADLHTRLTAEQREFYIGLWMESDDAGFVAWDVDRIGAELFPFEVLDWRRVHIPAFLEAIKPHACLLECGAHVFIPTLSRHQSPPKPSFSNRKAHEACMLHVAPAGTSGGHVEPAGTSTGREGKGREYEGGARGATLEELGVQRPAAVVGFHPVPKPPPSSRRK
jgi:hypothetical protein